MVAATRRRDHLRGTQGRTIADNTLTLPVFETVLRGIKVMGSLVGTDEVLAGKVPARLVFEFGD